MAPTLGVLQQCSTTCSSITPKNLPSPTAYWRNTKSARRRWWSSRRDDTIVRNRLDVIQQNDVYSFLPIVENGEFGTSPKPPT